MTPNDEYGTLEYRGVGRQYSFELDHIVYPLMRNHPRDRPDIRSLGERVRHGGNVLGRFELDRMYTRLVRLCEIHYAP